MISPDDILHFWFDEAGPKRWYVKDAGFDTEVKARFETAIDTKAEEVRRHGRSPWEATAYGALALVLLFDQFSRNIHRGSARAFAYDELARAAARHALDRGFDADVPAVRRAFFYLPFMHSEDLADQELCLELATQRLDDPATADFARRHLDVVRRFGRFPHRNAMLGRKSSADEEAFVKEHKGF